MNPGSCRGCTRMLPELSWFRAPCRLMSELESFLAVRSPAMDAVRRCNRRPGPTGELTGMLLIHVLSRKTGLSACETKQDPHVPDTAHGTNPASAALCGYRHGAAWRSNEEGILTWPEEVAGVMDEDTAGIMITNPNTLGLFEEQIKEDRPQVVHARGRTCLRRRGEHERRDGHRVHMGNGSASTCMHLNLAQDLFQHPTAAEGPAPGRSA